MFKSFRCDFLITPIFTRSPALGGACVAAYEVLFREVTIRLRVIRLRVAG